MTRVRNPFRELSSVFFLFWFLSTLTVSAQDRQENNIKSLTIGRTTGTIKADGKLNDPGWKSAGKIDDFLEIEPGENISPPIKTEAYITYDDDNLYVAMISHDDPSALRASFTERDRIDNDDRLGIFIDTYGDAAWAYYFFVNPYGIQSDQLFSQEYGQDPSYDLIWESAATITDSGYQVEMTIPFASLRFPNKNEQIWRVAFWNNHPRDSRHKYSWTPVDRNESCFPCQWGAIYGIRDVRPGKGIQIMPSVVGYQAGSINGYRFDANNNVTGTVFDNLDPDGELSMDLKYSVTSDITADLAINPDFSQIEADAAQIDVNSSSALFYPERRPFFQEGSDLFHSIFDIVYTRMINKPLAAGKLIGRLGRTNIGYIFAYDDNSPVSVLHEEGSFNLIADESFSNILRIRRTFGENSRVGLMLTDRRHKDDASGTVIGLDGSVRLNQNLSFNAHGVVSHTRESDNRALPGWVEYYMANNLIDSTFDDDKYTLRLDGESYWGHALYSSLDYDTRNIYFSVSHLETSPTYRPDIGYRFKNSQRGPRFYVHYNFWIDHSKVLERFTPSINFGREWNFDNERNYEFVTLSMETMFKAQTNMHNSYTKSSQLYRSKWYSDLYQWHTCLHSYFSDLLKFGGGINYGNTIARAAQTTGRETQYSIWVDIKPIDKLLIETAFNHINANRLDSEMEQNPGLEKNLYKDNIFWTKVSLQLSRELSIRLVAEYVDSYKYWSIDPLITYRLNPFTVFYAGSSYDYCEYELYNPEQDCTIKNWKLDSRQFFVKLRYLLQL